MPPCSANGLSICSFSLPQVSPGFFGFLIYIMWTEIQTSCFSCVLHICHASLSPLTPFTYFPCRFPHANPQCMHVIHPVPMLITGSLH